MPDYTDNLQNRTHRPTAFTQSIQKLLYRWGIKLEELNNYTNLSGVLTILRNIRRYMVTEAFHMANTVQTHAMNDITIHANTMPTYGPTNSSLISSTCWITIYHYRRNRSLLSGHLWRPNGRQDPCNPVTHWQKKSFIRRTFTEDVSVHVHVHTAPSFIERGSYRTSNFTHTFK